MATNTFSMCHPTTYIALALEIFQALDELQKHIDVAVTKMTV